MTSPARTRLLRVAAAAVAAVGIYCLAYQFVFYSLWRFLFGEEVWPWPPWSLWLLVILPAVAAVAAAAFVLAARLSPGNLWLAAGLGGLALLGLLRYAARVWKLVVQLGFHP
jgi:hypothetical protein